MMASVELEIKSSVHVLEGVAAVAVLELLSVALLSVQVVLLGVVEFTLIAEKLVTSFLGKKGELSGVATETAVATDDASPSFRMELLWWALLVSPVVLLMLGSHEADTVVAGGVVVSDELDDPAPSEGGPCKLDSVVDVGGGWDCMVALEPILNTSNLRDCSN